MDLPNGHGSVAALLRQALDMLDEQGQMLAAIHVSHALDVLAAADARLDGTAQHSQPTAPPDFDPEADARR